MPRRVYRAADRTLPPPLHRGTAAARSSSATRRRASSSAGLTAGSASTPGRNRSPPMTSTAAGAWRNTSSAPRFRWRRSPGTRPSRKVIYRSKRSWHTKRNFQVFEATDFLAAAVEHIPPKGQHTVRYYGLYSNKRRGMDARNGRPRPSMRGIAAPRPAGSSTSDTLLVLPPPEPKSARALRPLWRDLIRRVWGEDPMICPCCKGIMKTAGTMMRRDEVEFFLQLHGLWEGILSLPPPPSPPFDIETMEPLDVPPQWGWSDEIEPPPEDWWRGEDAGWPGTRTPPRRWPSPGSRRRRPVSRRGVAGLSGGLNQ